MLGEGPGSIPTLSGSETTQTTGMDQKIVYSKTGKGVLEIKNKAGKLSRELAKVLGLVDGKSSVEDLIAKSKLSDADIARVLKQLEDRGYIKEFSSLSGAMSSASSVGSSSYVDDLDFTKQLSPGKRVYSSSQAEMRARESADREQAEAEARRKREEAEQKKKAEAAKQAREEAARLARIEAERKAKEAAALKAKQEAELKKQQQASDMEKTTRDLAKILEAERQALEKSSRQKKEEQARKAEEEAGRRGTQDAERRAKEEAERKRREEEERKRREEEERRRREEEERKRREEEERKRREEEERKRREEEDRKRREEEERKRREEEERKRREEEEERKRREEEERKRREEEERKRREEEERRRREEEERRRREEEDRRREEEDRRREEEDRRREEEQRKRRGEEEDERRRREEEEQRRRNEEEEEERRRREEDDRRREEETASSASFDIGDFDLPSVSETEKSSTSSFELPEASESDTSFDAPSLDSEASESFAVDFDRQQELRRKQEEEEESQRRQAEEARIAAERARREEEAREEAARRSELEAEMRARVEQEKLERAERERAKREEYQRKIEQDEDRKKQEAARKEREQFERTESERKKREDDLARRRHEAEEADRKRAELKRLQKSGRIRSPMERARPFVIGVIVLVALVVGAIQVMPMSGYIPAVEKMVSDNVGEPVTIGSMKMSVLSGLQFRLGNVNIGTTQDVSLNDVVVTPELGSLFGDELVLSSIRADGGTIVREALVRMPDWLAASIADRRIAVRKMSLQGIKLEMQTFSLPSLNADVNFRRDGGIVSAAVETADGKLSVNISNAEGVLEVDIRASNWTAPIGAPLQLTDFTGSGTINGATLRLNEWDATVYGGQAKGTAAISWAPRWGLASEFEFARVETEELLAVFSDTAKVTGSSSGTARLSAQAGSIDALLDRPTLQASFSVKKGTVDGVDLVRALQAGRAGTQGGSTRFEELTGNVTVANGRFSYTDVELAAGILSAQSDFNISSDQDLSGRVDVALRSPAQRLSANLNLSGNLKGPTLRP